MSISDTKLLNARDVCATFGISRATLYRRVDDGTFPRPIRFGGAVRWLPADIEAVIQRSRPAAQPQEAGR